MANDWFRFKKFIVHQSGSAMKVGTDGVLLGAWSSLPVNGNKILDIGTGTGLISLMLAQKFPQSAITAIEIDHSSCLQAKKNVNISEWSERIEIIENSFQNYADSSKKKFDLIVSNPPYFEGSLKSGSMSRTTARHQDSLPTNELIMLAADMLQPETGLLSLILPSLCKQKTIETAADYGLYPTRILNIRPTPEKEFKRFMVEFSRKQKCIQETEIFIELSRHNYSDEYTELTKDFYPGM